MTKPLKIAARIAVVAAALLVVLLATAIFILRSAWFENYARAKVISSIEASTGGKAELQSFVLHWTSLRAQITGLVIHGTEPAADPPLFAARSIIVEFKLSSPGPFSRFVDLKSLRVDQPEVDVMVFPDGQTNIPTPKSSSPSSMEPRTVVNLLSHTIDIRDGVFQFLQQKQAFSIHGRDFRAEIAYNPRAGRYDGEVSVSPLSLQSEQRSPVDATITIPLTLERDKAQISNAKISTPGSLCILNARVDNLNAPALTAGLSIHLSLEEMKRGLNLPISLVRGAPQFLDGTLGIRINDKSWQIQDSRLTLGNTYVEVSGNLKDSAADVRGGLSLEELAALFQIPDEPRGFVNISGKASFKSQSDYLVEGNAASNDISFQWGDSRISGFRVDAPVRVDPKAIELKGLKLGALGGDAVLDARLEDFANLSVNGTLHGFRTQTLVSSLLAKRSAYGGTIGGTFDAQGNLKAPGASSFRAQAKLTVVPNGSGTPVSGQINAGFSGATNIVSLGRSFLALPNSRINLGGEIGPGRQEAQVDVESRNLSDFSPAIAMFSTSPPDSSVALKGGAGKVTARIHGPLAAPQIASDVDLTGLAIGERSFDHLAGAFGLSPSAASVRNGTVTGKSVQASFSGSLGLHHWSPEPRDLLNVTATIQRADLADVLALAGQPQIPGRGAMNGDVHISGTFGNPLGSAQVAVVNGSLYDQPFDHLSAQADLSSGLITLRAAQMADGSATVDAQGSFVHPQDGFETGHLQLRVNSNQVSLAQIKPLQKQHPELAGTVALNANLAGDLRRQPAAGKSPTAAGDLQFVLSNVDGSLKAAGVRDKNGSYGDFTATAHTTSGEVSTVVDSDFAGSRIHLTGRTRLAADYPTTADGSIQGLPIEKALAILAPEQQGQRGVLSATAHVSGTLNDPQGRLNFDLTNAVLFDEPVNRATGALDYTHDKVNVSSIQVSSPAGQVTANGWLEHSGFDFANGRAEAHLATTNLNLQRVKNVQEFKPGLNGVLRVTADVGASLQKPQGATLQFRPTRVDATGGLTGLQWNGQALGDLTFQGETKGILLSVNLNSDLGKSTIKGTGRVNLTGDYQTNADLTFSNVTYSGMKYLLPPGTDLRPGFDALVEGQAHVTGPATQPNNLKGEVRLTRVELVNTRPGRGTAGGRNVILQNQGPMVANLDRSMVRISSARLTGRSTDLSVTGSVVFDQSQSLDLAVRGSADLKVANDVNPDLFSSGIITLDSTVHGSVHSPAIAGKIDLKNASMSFTDISNGLDNANGEILLNGNTATIRTLTAETGGGKVIVTGNVSYNNGQLLPNMRLNASHVRVRYSGASIKASAALTLSGTNERSALTGNATIEQVAYNQQSDMGSMLSQVLGATPQETPEAASGEGLLANCHLNVSIKTAPDVRFRTTLAQDLAGSANLTARGTLSQPGMTGRVDLTSGSMVFFGHTYTVNRGSVSFYDATKIEPVLDLELATTADSVSVIVGFSGPIENLKMSYRSDPPLKFDEITALLTTNQTPNDATIAAHTPPAPSQTTVQMGESALLGQAVANPAATRLQRVFGVTQFKVDPSFTSGGSLPSARVTFQQQVSGAITFTYTNDLTQANSEIIRVEWAINPRFSAIATRDEYGIFGIDFIYKKQFR